MDKFYLDHHTSHLMEALQHLDSKELGTVTRTEQTISNTYATDTTRNKELTFQLLDTIEELNDLTPNDHRRNAIDFIIALWDEIATTNLSEID